MEVATELPVRPSSADTASKDLILKTLPPTPPESTIDDSNGVFQTRSNDKEEFPLPPVVAPPTQVLDVDKSTPDAHVPRDSRLIRLTGVHPFNVEAPLTDLYNEGFLTSPNLFYVRNHGAVPQVEDHEIMDWSFTISGYDSWPFTERY
jgi:nitrate reductase (NAD(P)H)